MRRRKRQSFKALVSSLCQDRARSILPKNIGMYSRYRLYEVNGIKAIQHRIAQVESALLKNLIIYFHNFVQHKVYTYDNNNKFK